MFGLDTLILNFFFSQFKMLGTMFGFGAFEGFILYLGVMMAGISSITGKEKK